MRLLLLGIVVLPVVVRCSLFAKYFIYIGGMCEAPTNFIAGVVLPWVLGAVINHLQIYSYLINWTALCTSMFVQWVCPMFLWAKASKEASIYEANFKASMQMILSNASEHPLKGIESDYESADERITQAHPRTDGVPSIDHSTVLKFRGTPHVKRGIPSAKFLQTYEDLNSMTNDDNYEEDMGDRMSNITEAFYEEETNNKRFLKIYNMQGHYSSTQSIASVFGQCFGL